MIIINKNINKGIIMGYFNSPLTDDEKCGGLAVDEDSKIDFANFIHNLAFIDVDLLGGSFTWSNRIFGGEFI